MNSSNKACSFGGTDESKFGEPMLWIGIYVSLASLVCVCALGLDIIRGLKWGKVWFPPKFFIINAAMLTFLGIATKIPGDVNGKMPGMFDQLAKLSGTMLICIAISHALPSFGIMDGEELVSNMVALGILVVSTTVSIWFQLHTELITTFAYLNRMYTLVMLVLYAISVSHALSVTAVKSLLNRQFKDKNRRFLEEVSINDGDHIDHGLLRARLKGYLQKYWLMAFTSSPDYVMLTSGLPFACASLHWYAVCSFIGILLGSWKVREKGCYAASDYKWSAGATFFIQSLAIIVSVPIAIRRLFLINNAIDYTTFINPKHLFDIENYGLQLLLEWKKEPLSFHIRDTKRRKIAHFVKTNSVNLLIVFQFFAVFLTRLLILSFKTFCFIISLLFSLPYLGIVKCCGRSTSSDERSSKDVVHRHLYEYVMTIDGIQKQDPEKIVPKWKDHHERWIREGKARRPTNLHHLITSKLNMQQAFITDEQKCWSIHLATLMCIGHTLSHRSAEHQGDLQSLLKAVDEGFPYVMFVDENRKTPEKRMLDSARMVWQHLLFHEKWLDLHLNQSCTIEGLREGARKCQVQDHGDDYSELSLDAIAAESMFHLTNNHNFSSFEELEMEVVRVLGSCLARLPFAMFNECSRGGYGFREYHVRAAARVHGETEEILQILEGKGYVLGHSNINDNNP